MGIGESTDSQLVVFIAYMMIPLAYLLGALPSGYIIGRISKGIDIREHGSGKTGMSNVLRLIGKKAAVLVLLIDCSKGALAVFLAQLLVGNPVVLVSVAIAVLLGHNYSVFIRFHGGAGVLTGVGTLFAFVPLAGIVAAVVGGLMILIFRYMSLGSMAGTLAAFVTAAYLWAFNDHEATATIYIAMGASLIFFRHKENIYRLISGTAPKLASFSR